MGVIDTTGLQLHNYTPISTNQMCSSMFIVPRSFCSPLMHLSLFHRFPWALHQVGLKNQRWCKRSNLCPCTQNDILITMKQLCFSHYELTEAVSVSTLSRYSSLTSLKKINKMNLEKISLHLYTLIKNSIISVCEALLCRSD